MHGVVSFLDCTLTGWTSGWHATFVFESAWRKAESTFSGFPFECDLLFRASYAPRLSSSGAWLIDSFPLYHTIWEESLWRCV
jgi:hypothetical protein